MAVSNVSATSPSPMVMFLWYGARRKAFRQAPTASGRPVSSPDWSRILTWSSSTTSPQFLAMAITCRMCSPCGTSPDSKPRTSTACSPSKPRAFGASPGSSKRQFAGHNFVCTICLTASAPAPKEENVTAAEARKRGRAWSRVQASAIIPRIPSLPNTSRSGLGPAPLPGRRRDSQMPLGVTIRTDSTKSSM